MRWLPVMIVIAFLSTESCGADTDSPTDGGADSVSVADSGPASAPLTADELAQACLRASACGLKTYPVLANCIEAYHKLYRSQGVGPVWDSIYRCVNEAAGDCETTATCFDRRGNCDSSFVASCEEQIAISCDLIDKQIYAMDCGAAGLECGMKSGTTAIASCTTGSCYSNLPPACKGDLLLTCIGGITEIRDCAAEGLTCGTTDNGKTTTCLGKTDTKCFAPNFPKSCQGDTAITCAGDREHHFDCTQQQNMATKCDEAACVLAGSQCDHEVNRCAGDRLEACLDGSWQSFDCLQLGLGPCQTQTSGANCGAP